MKKYILCPICGEFYFVVRNGDAINNISYLKDEIVYQKCLTCAWTYDQKQLKGPDIVTERNSISFNERKRIMEDGRKKDKEFNYYDVLYPLVPHLCPVCNEFMFPSEESNEICDICGWQDDVKDPTKEESFANELPYKEFLANYEKTKKLRKEE